MKKLLRPFIVAAVAIAAVIPGSTQAGQQVDGASGNINKNGSGDVGDYTAVADPTSNGSAADFTGDGTFPSNPLAGDFYWDDTYDTYESDPNRSFASLYFVVWTTQLPGQDPVRHWRLYMHNHPLADTLQSEGTLTGW